MRMVQFLDGVGAPASAAARSASDVARGDVGMAAVLLAIAGWVVFLGAYDQWGRDRRRPRRRRGDPPEDVQLPADAPAVAHALHSGGSADPGVLGAILLDLARRGYLEIIEGRRAGALGESATDWTFRRGETPRGDLRPYENALYTRLFAAGNETTVGSVLAWAGANRQQARVFLERIRRYVSADLREEGYLERPRRLPLALNLGVASAVVLVGLGALVSGAFIGIVAAASGALQASRTHVLRRQTLSGSDRSHQWEEIAHALEKVASLDEPPAASREEWERCLVYAAALGVVGPFVAGLEEREPKLFRHKDFVRWYQSDPDGPRLAGIGLLADALGRWLADAAEGPPRASLVHGGVVTPG